MVQKGDTVRYLNEVGGGKVTRVEDKIAYVDDDGFERPVQVKELVVVIPAGHEPEVKGAKKMFDQKAFDTGRSAERPQMAEKQEKTAHADKSAGPVAAVVQSAVIEEEDFPIVETDYGDDMTIVLGFEPENIKQLNSTAIQAVLVNDSNYFLDWQLLRRSNNGRGWTLAARGEAAPNELVDVASYTQESIRQLERIVFQAIASKRDKDFEAKEAINVSRKIDLTKFFKLHCFRPGVYFENPVIEMKLYAEKSRK